MYFGAGSPGYKKVPVASSPRYICTACRFLSVGKSPGHASQCHEVIQAQCLDDGT